MAMVQLWFLRFIDNESSSDNERFKLKNQDYNVFDMK